MVKPGPADVVGLISWVIEPITKSPAAVGAMAPVEGVLPLPLALLTGSSGATGSAPENSAATIDNSFPEVEVEKVILSLPALTFLAKKIAEYAPPLDF